MGMLPRTFVGSTGFSLNISDIPTWAMTNSSEVAGLCEDL